MERTPTKWKCEECKSVCAGTKEVVPSPCDFCGSTRVVEVSLSTPTSPPNRRLVAS